MIPGKRKRSNSDSVGISENENPIEVLNLKVENLQKGVSENGQKQEETDKNIKKILAKLEKLERKEDSEILEMKNQQKLILEKLEKMEKSKEKEDSEANKKPSFNSVISPGHLMKNTLNNRIPPAVGRSFVLKHVFENVSKFREGKNYRSEKEEHFGAPWRMSVARKDEHLAFYLTCLRPLNESKYAIGTEFVQITSGIDGKIKTVEERNEFGNADGNTEFDSYGDSDFLKWEELEKDYLVDDKLTVEIHVKIVKMTGVYKENLRCFDESMKEFSDVILKIGDEKFYVSKLFLASHSSYFKTLFLGQFQESNQSEIPLSGVDSEDFQKFLEAVYGYSVVDEFTVEGIVMLADMYDTSIVIEKCEEFLIEKSKKSNKKKLQMSIRYHLDKLKEKCMLEIKTVADIKSVIPGKLEDLEPSIMAEFFEKLISLS